MSIKFTLSLTDKKAIQIVKKTFFPVNGEACNHHFPVEESTLPSRYEVDYFGGHLIGKAKSKNKSWELLVCYSPHSSMAVFGASKFSLIIRECDKLS